MSEIALTTDEQADLAQLEAVIERGMNTFIEVGNALAAIHEQKLYRSEHDTFEDYCRDRWAMGRAHAYRMIEAAQVVSPIGDTDLPAPKNEAQARELARVPGPERVDVWRETVERTDGQPTAAAVRETYAARADEVVDAELVDEPTHLEPPKQKRRPLPEAFTDAGRDLTRAAERLARLTEDDRFAKNRETTHHQVPELLGALEHTARLVTAMNLPAAGASEEARRWWATSLHKISDALTDVANSLEKEL